MPISISIFINFLRNSACNITNIKRQITTWKIILTIFNTDKGLRKRTTQIENQATDINRKFTKEWTLYLWLDVDYALQEKFNLKLY